MATKAEEKAIDNVLFHLGVDYRDVESSDERKVLIKLLDEAYDRGYAAAVADALDDGNFGGK